MNELMQQMHTGLPPHGRRLVRKEEVQGLSPVPAPKKQPHNRGAYSLGILNFVLYSWLRILQTC
jgi:hypothetical protein